ncbi:oxidoreductase [Microbacterium pumilum]|uniref:Oxidoreductase n=1 Tax=Microbacterium pumilum TaxID=344165 RepID=A0ABN2S437_9MICO
MSDPTHAVRTPVPAWRTQVHARPRRREIPASGWTVDLMPSLVGKTVIVTGANSGIGLETARVFAAKGAHVVFAVRDETRGRDAAAGVSGSTEVRRLDLADLQSVRAFADAWTDDIHILVNNAGVMVPPLGRTADGFELQFGINHLGHFALTNLLLPHVSGRVVTVASSAHRSATMDFDDLNWLTRRYGTGSGGYEQSKLANLLFTLELQRRLERSGLPVIAVAAHPGMTATNLMSSSESPAMIAFAKVAVRLFAQDPAMGATPTLFAATADLPGGSYAGPSRRREMAGPPILVGRSMVAADPVVAARLWAASEELTGVRYPGAICTSGHDRNRAKWARGISRLERQRHYP